MKKVLCKCGCGLKTKPATITNRKYGWVKGKPNKYIKGHNKPWLGKKRGPMPESVKKKMRKSHLGLKHNMTEKGINAIRENLKKAHLPENVERMRKTLTGRKLTNEQMWATLSVRKISSFEKIFISLIDAYGLPYKYVGDGSFLIGGYSPDFINSNGEKIAIETYYSYFKTERGAKDISEWKNWRKLIFGKYGWKVIFFNEDQIKDDYFMLSSLGINFLKRRRKDGVPRTL